MKPCLLLTIVAALTFAFVAPDSTSAATSTSTRTKALKKAKPTPEPEKSKAFSEIKAVSGDSITVEHSKTSTTYKMSRDTQIQIDGNRASAANLKPGMHVEVTPSGINPTLLLSVAATTPPKN